MIKAIILKEDEYHHIESAVGVKNAHPETTLLRARPRTPNFNVARSAVVGVQASA